MIEVWTDSLKGALYIAIEAQRRYEREELKYESDSAMLAGWQDLYDKIDSVSFISLKRRPRL